MAGGSSWLLSAGEPIIFGREKTKADPVKETKFGKEISKPWENLSEPSPFNIAPVLPRKAPFDPKKDKRRKAELEEKKNWIFVERGELQDKVDEEEDQFGVREYNFDESGKEDGTIRDLTFKDMGKNRADLRSPGQGRTSGQQQKQNANQAAQQQRREREDAEDEAKRDSRSKLDLRGTGDPGLGTAGQVNLKGLLEIGAVPNAEKGDSSFNSSGSGPDFSREQQARRNEFKSFLSGPSAPNTLSGPSDPINQRNDLTRQPANPVFPKPADPAVKTGGDPNLFRGAPANPYADAYNSPAFDANSSRGGVSGFGIRSPFFQPPETPRPSFGSEQPKMFNRSLGGHGGR
jgi:hypothetical protein